MDKADDDTVDLSCFMSKRSPRDEALKVVYEDGLMLKKASILSTSQVLIVAAFKIEGLCSPKHEL
jgi:hypothetical protein